MNIKYPHKLEILYGMDNTIKYEDNRGVVLNLL